MPTNSVFGNVERKTLQKKALAMIEDLPSLSDVVREFLEVASRDYFTAADFDEVIQKDSALTARLLKVANSSFYAGTRSIKTIREAVVLIGMDNMKNMVYAVSSSGLLSKEFKSYQFPDRGFWMHSMGVGIACRVLAREAKTKVLGPEEAFVAGLLHDVGKLILDKLLITEEGIREISLEEETEAAGLNHADLARHIFRKWKIPEVLIEAVRFHHDPFIGGRPKAGAVLINLANSVLKEWGLGTKNVPDLSIEIEATDHLQEIRALIIPRDKFTSVLWELRQDLADIDKLYQAQSEEGSE